MSEISIRHLQVTRRLPVRAQVGRAHVVEIEVRNTKTRIPSYAIEIEDLRQGQPADKRCFFLKVSPGTSQVAAYRRTPARRGRDHHVGFRIATRFPFGLFEKSREVDAPGELVIYPATDPVSLPQGPTPRPNGDGHVLAPKAGSDTFGVRPMRPGDEARDIYWRKSSQQLVVRERGGETSSRVTLQLENRPPTETPDEGWSRNFERQVRDIASRGVAHLKRGDAVAIRCSSGETLSVDRSKGADPLLRFLALVPPEPLAPGLGGPVSDPSRLRPKESRA
jgi:uncharacterized protein (DUF58 family)